MGTSKVLPSADWFRCRCQYDPESGAIRSNHGDIGRIRLRRDGYLDCHVKFKGKWTRMLAHRIAWLIVIGFWPSSVMDHKNGIRNDNRWSNFRLASQLDNAHNKKMHRNNRCGYKGVRCRNGKISARITINGKRISLGVFKTAGDAARAYENTAQRHFGEFATCRS